MATSVKAACNQLTPAQNGVELQKVLTAMQADIAALHSAATTLATKLNADGGVTDTNYAAPAALTSAA